MKTQSRILTQMDVAENTEPLTIEASSRRLLNVRLWFYGICTTHFLILGANLLTIDYDSYNDDRLKKYEAMRFRLLTVWANLMHLAYFPLCLYYTWREASGRHLGAKMRMLNKFRHFWFTALLFPTTAYVDIFFWRTWMIDRELLVPKYCDVMLPWWAQQGLHTNTLIFVLIELVVVPRFRPNNLKYHVLAANIYCPLYLAVALWTHHNNNLWVYPFLEKLSPFKLILFGISFWAEYRFFSYVQWLVIDLVWAHRLNGELVRRHLKKSALFLVNILSSMLFFSNI